MDVKSIYPYYYGSSQPSYISPFISNWYNALSVKPSQSLLDSLNELYDGIDADSNMLFDLLHPIGGLETMEQRVTPIISTSGTSFVNVNGGTLNANGFTGDGATSYLNLNWNPSTNGVNYSLNNACFGVYSRTNSQSANADMGCADPVLLRFSQIYCRYIDDSLFIRINQGVGLSNKTTSDSLGLKVGARNDSATIETFDKGTSLGTNSINSTGLPNLPLFLGALNLDGSAAQFNNRNYALVMAGSANINQGEVNTRVQTYMTQRGIQV